MHKLKIISSTVLTVGMTISMPTPARADFGDVMLGIGAGAATSIIINSNNRRATEERYKPVPPEQEYYRGVQDGINGAKYDNPRNSSDYDKGYQEGLDRSSKESSVPLLEKERNG
ncbi:MAG TPA: hypothetical protein ACFCUY_19080 [Xenococcaceae cyanobacterium]